MKFPVLYRLTFLIHCQHCGSPIQQGLNHGGQTIPGSNVEGPEI